MFFLHWGCTSIYCPSSYPFRSLICEISGRENKILWGRPNSPRTSTSQCILDIRCIGFGGRGQRLIILFIRISEFILKSSKFWISLQHFEQKSWVLSHKLSCRTLISLLRSENNGVGYQQFFVCCLLVLIMLGQAIFGTGQSRRIRALQG